MIDLIKKLPKAELHIHIEGSFEPQLMVKLSQKNNIPIPYKSVEEVYAAYKFDSLQSFLDIYYAACKVLIHEEDFFQLSWAYFQKCNEQNVRHTQIFFDPQSHTERGVQFQTIIKGLRRAQQKAQKELNVSSYLIMCFLRHLSQESALKTLQVCLPFKDWIIGVGLDSSQVGNPPEKFSKVFKKAHQYGFKKVAHAGQEGPADYIWSSIKLLEVHRIDHGVRCIDDQNLLALLIQKQIPLTCCPLSNIFTKVFAHMSQNNFKILLNKGLRVTINSDDPAYFGGYLNQNYIQTATHLKMSNDQIKQTAINSFKASFLPEQTIQSYIEKIKAL